MHTGNKLMHGYVSSPPMGQPQQVYSFLQLLKSTYCTPWIWNGRMELVFILVSACLLVQKIGFGSYNREQMKILQRQHGLNQSKLENSVTRENQNVYKAKKTEERGLVNFMEYFYFGGLMKESKVLHLHQYVKNNCL